MTSSSNTSVCASTIMGRPGQPSHKRPQHAALALRSACTRTSRLGCSSAATRLHATARRSTLSMEICFARLAGLLENRYVGVVGVEEVSEVPPRPDEYFAQLIRRHHEVVHPWANDVTKTHAYPDLTR